MKTKGTYEFSASMTVDPKGFERFVEALPPPPPPELLINGRKMGTVRNARPSSDGLGMTFDLEPTPELRAELYMRELDEVPGLLDETALRYALDDLALLFWAARAVREEM